MRNLAISVVASGFVVMSAQAVAGAEVAKVNVPAPQVKLNAPKVNAPKVGSNQSKSFEIKDFSFGVENPTSVGSSKGGAGAGKINLGGLSVTDPKACRHCLKPRPPGK